MGNDMVIVARTDSLDASFIDNNIDPIDHPWILGVVDPAHPEATKTFPVAGRDAIAKTFKGQEAAQKLSIWNSSCLSLGLDQARKLASDLGFHFYFDWEACRTEEGYYRLKGDLDYCSKRALAFSDYADIIWMETHSPDLQQAKEFADKVHSVKPNVMLGYNNSPSFNWDLYFKNSEDLEDFIPNMGKLGYVW
eukprot:scpid78801/ scgid26529/ Isocitrate lyase